MTSEVKDHVRYCTWWTPKGSTLFLKDDTCDGGDLDKAGVFTAKTPGLYQASEDLGSMLTFPQVTVSVQVELQPGDRLDLWVKHNTLNMEGGAFHFENDKTAFGPTTDNAALSLMVNLKVGEKVSLHADRTAFPMGAVPFCVSSVDI